jgi:hypothetical protein
MGIGWVLWLGVFPYFWRFKGIGVGWGIDHIGEQLKILLRHSLVLFLSPLLLIT